MFRETKRKHFETKRKHFETNNKIMYNVKTGNNMAWGTAVAGGLTAIGSLLSTSMANGANASMNQATRRWQTEENEKSRAFAERMYNAENAYNTPSAQKARLMEAGINPYMNDSQIGAGTANAPTQTAPNSAPSPIPMQSYQDTFSNLGRLAEVLMRKKAVDAESDNQRAQAERTRIENASRLLQMGYSPSDVVKVMRATNPDYKFDNYGDSMESRSVNALISVHEAKASLDDVQAQIDKQFGFEKAQQINWNLQQQGAKMVTEMGLMNSLSKVYESQVSLNASQEELNYAKVDEAIQSAYHHWATAEYVQMLGLTEDQKRDYFIAILKAQAAVDSMDAVSAESDFSEEESLRKYKHTKSAKVQRLFGYSLENNAATNLVDFVGKRASTALGRSSAPARASLKRKSTYTENGMTPRGYKAQRRVEEYDYE